MKTVEEYMQLGLDRRLAEYYASVSGFIDELEAAHNKDYTARKAEQSKSA